MYLQNGEVYVAPYWSSLQGNHKSGINLFHHTTDTGVRDRATNDIRTYFPEYLDFEASWAFIATWHNIPYSSECETEAILVSNLLKDSLSICFATMPALHLFEIYPTSQELYHIRFNFSARAAM